MLSTKKLVPALLLTCLLIPMGAYAFQSDDEEDYLDDQPARVARIKYLEGEAQIKRVDAEDWEEAVTNLPLVEGDWIETGSDTRLEIQFDKDTYLRVDRNTSFQIAAMDYEGIALSVHQGSVAVTMLEFDLENGYFEVDAPKTTIAVAGDGTYRIDAGDDYDRSVRVSVANGGKARVYSADSGITLNSDQAAVMSLEGAYAGQWEISRFYGLNDDFEDWYSEREELVNEDLRDAYYGRYYDQDIYGADDLNDHGDWVYDDDYGYVWSPYQSSIYRYSNWSPYRYGHWRWLPYYGWTWVNDEPWGWATYHHGRWIWRKGRWVWTPYGYSRYSRSWWRPAIVYIGYVGNRVCWYPLPYGYSYYDYNRRYRNYWGNHRRNGNRRGNNNNAPAPTTRNPNPLNVARASRNLEPPLGRVPPGGVISTPSTVFGKGRRGFDTAPPEVSTKVLANKPVIANSPPLLPSRKDIGKTMGPDIIVADRKPVTTKMDRKIGAGDRKTGEPMDKKLNDQKIGTRRPPLTTIPSTVPNPNTNRTGTDQRKTAVPTRKAPTTAPVPRSTPPTRPDPVEKKSPPVRKAQPSPPVYVPPKRTQPSERKTPPPVYNPAPKRSEPPKRTSPPPRQQQPRKQAPPKPPPAKKAEPPKKSAPKPPVKQSPKKPPTDEKSE